MDSLENYHSLYFAVLKSGMMFELFPELTGNWESDQHVWAFLINNLRDSYDRRNEDPSSKR
jgi:hypothetical protein